MMTKGYRSILVLKSRYDIAFTNEGNQYKHHIIIRTLKQLWKKLGLFKRKDHKNWVEGDKGYHGINDNICGVTAVTLVHLVQQLTT